MTIKFIGRTEHTTALHAFKKLNDGSLEYTRVADDEVYVRDDNGNELFDEYMIGINDGEFLINEKGQLVYVY